MDRDDTAGGREGTLRARVAPTPRRSARVGGRFPAGHRSGARLVIRRLQVLNYRGIRYLDLRLAPFQILVGRNASGKSTVLDAIAFLRDLVASGLDAAVEKRTRNFQDLVWGRPTEDLGFELAVECGLAGFDPEAPPAPEDDRVFRYEVAVREEERAPRITAERGLLGRLGAPGFGKRRARFPDPPPAPETIFVDARTGEYRQVLSRTDAGAFCFEPETAQLVSEPRESPYSFGPGRPSLAHLPDAPDDFPAAFRVRRLLTEARSLFVDCAALRRPSPYSRDTKSLSSDGGNLPWVVRRLRSEDEERFEHWLENLRFSLPEVEGVRVVVREEDRRAYLMVRYAAGHEVPSWSVSDGTLRLMAQTLSLHARAPETIHLIEEPEAGVHPEVMQDVLDALQPAGDRQVLAVTQSPAILTDAHAKTVLCLAKDERGLLDAIPALSHPRMEGWIGDPHLGNLFAGGLLG